MKTISLIIPMYNEEKVVQACYDRIKKIEEALPQYNHEIVIIDDGSTDNTLTLLTNLANQDNCLTVLSFSRNFGHQAAVTAGLKQVTR